jgi:hypothetical protein
MMRFGQTKPPQPSSAHCSARRQPNYHAQYRGGADLEAVIDQDLEQLARQRRSVLRLGVIPLEEHDPQRQPRRDPDRRVEDDAERAAAAAAQRKEQVRVLARVRDAEHTVGRDHAELQHAVRAEPERVGQRAVPAALEPAADGADGFVAALCTCASSAQGEGSVVGGRTPRMVMLCASANA